MSLKRSFPPVADARTRLLLLGSLPGEQSLARGQYYANPRNQFWRLIGAVIGANLEALDYEARLTALLDAGVGLWDTVESATRLGSLDGNIRGHSPNDLVALIASLPELRAIGFNGGKSASLGMKQLSGRTDLGLSLSLSLSLSLIPLPSSSPAFTLKFAAKAGEWAKLKAFL
jgi:TDG/mug DNA glycosylase family protein